MTSGSWRQKANGALNGIGKPEMLRGSTAWKPAYKDMIVFGKSLRTLFLFLTLAGICSSNLWAEMTTASWYSRESAQREGTSGILTASGERFNENAQTCAHPSLPFGTILKVKNPKNGTWIYCRVNDRGPAQRLVRKGRKLDLTPHAYRLLGLDLEKGLARVDVREVRP